MNISTILIKGLSFNIWNTETLEIIAKECGGLVEIDQQTLIHISISEAIMRVKGNGASVIPQVISFKVDDIWIPIQLTPLLTIQSDSRLSDNYTRKAIPSTENARDCSGRQKNNTLGNDQRQYSVLTADSHIFNQISNSNTAPYGNFDVILSDPLQVS